MNTKYVDLSRDLEQRTLLKANLPFYFPNSACPKLPYNKETSPSFYFASELGFYTNFDCTVKHFLKNMC